MKYAFYPGCVARGGAPELYESAMAVLDRLGIETIELTRASCTGAGVLQEKNRKLGDILNVRTLAMAEQLGLPIMTICSTCQGVISQANHAVQTRPAYLEEINAELADEGHRISGHDGGQTPALGPAGRRRHRKTERHVRQRAFRYEPRAVLRVLHRQAERCAGPRRQSATADVTGNRDRGDRRKRSRLSGQDGLLRIPDSPHQPGELAKDGVESHRRSE